SVLARKPGDQRHEQILSQRRIRRHEESSGSLTSEELQAVGGQRFASADGAELNVLIAKQLGRRHKVRLFGTIPRVPADLLRPDIKEYSSSPLLLGEELNGRAQLIEIEFAQRKLPIERAQHFVHASGARRNPAAIDRAKRDVQGDQTHSVLRTKTCPD